MAHMEVVKKGKNFILYKADDRDLIKIEGVRFSYPFFGEQREEESEDDGSKRKSWRGVAMLPKATHGAAKEAFMQLVEKLKNSNKVKIPSEYICLKDGDDKDDESMHGHWLISFSDSGKRRPSVRTVHNEILTESEEIDEMFYGGCWGSVLLRPWYFNGQAKGKKKTYPKRICCGYNGVQFLRGDTPFGSGRVDDTDAWGDESGGGDDDDEDGI